MMNAEGLYPHLPVFLQNFACTYYGFRERRVRMGQSFRRHLRSLLGSEFASRGEIDSIQDRQIAELIRYSYENVPFYRSLMRKHGLHPNDIESREALRLLPVLTKEDIFESAEELLSKCPVGSPLRTAKTSGTTGTALSFYTTEDAVAFTWAVWWRHRHRFGFRPGDWHVNFTGNPVVPVRQENPPHWRIDRARKQIIVTGSHLVPGKIDALAAYINKAGCRYFTGYPSQIAQFCYLLGSEGSVLTNGPSFIFSGAESVQEFQRHVITQVTGAQLTDHYGFAEGAVNASRCEHGNYHEDWEYGFMECVDPVYHADGSFTGKVVGTGFANRAFPFIRYEVGDTATWAPDGYRCPCGRQSRVIWQIDGRNEDYILTPEGNQVMRFDYLFKDSIAIKEAQVVQREPGKILIRLVSRPGFGSAETDRIRKLAAEWISESLVVDFEEVVEIERSSSGKFKPVISELSSEK